MKVYRAQVSQNITSNYHDNYSAEAFSLQTNTFDVIPRRKRITMFKAGGHWIFKHFFDDRETFRELADHYDKDLYRFEFKRIENSPQSPTPKHPLFLPCISDLLAFLK